MQMTCLSAVLSQQPPTSIETGRHSSAGRAMAHTTAATPAATNTTSPTVSALLRGTA